MAPSKLAIHVLPDSNPENTISMIRVLAENPDLSFETSKDLVDFLKDQGVNANDWVQSTATSMGILERGAKNTHLSSMGMVLGRLREDVRGDLLHFLMYSGWNPTKPLEFLQSWAYRACCDHYWQARDMELTSAYLDNLVENTINIARDAFTAMNVGDFEEISFSRKSLTGVHKWLEALHPEVLPDKGKRFVRRAFCPPELLVMAIGHVLKDESAVIGTDILLTREKRESLCRICLLAPEYLDRTLDWTINTFPSLLAPGTSAGFYGRFVRLSKIPSFEDIVR